MKIMDYLMNDYLWECMDKYGDYNGTIQWLITIWGIKFLVCGIVLCFSLIIALFLVKMFLKIVDKTSNY